VLWRRGWAINAPVQGTSADILKIAMVGIDKYLIQNKLEEKVRMLLQVHDEVVLEVPTEDIDKVSKKVKDVMESVYKLKVPIKVDISVGGNWDECK